MSKIGTAEYPTLSFTRSLELIDTIWREKITTVDGLAKRLGHKSPKSGTFFVKMAALNKYYRLLDQSRSEIVLTQRAQRILMGTSESERAEARREAVETIPLFRDLFGKLGSDFNRDDFIPVLRELTGATLEELNQRGLMLRKMYEDAARYMESKRIETPVREPELQTARGMLVLQVPDKPQIQVPWEPHFIESVMEFLKSAKEDLERGRKKGESSSPSTKSGDYEGEPGEQD